MTNRRTSREQEAHSYYQNYAEYNRTLRAWFVVFGVGGPATLIAHRDLATQLAKAGTLRCVVIAFLLGAAAQVLIALINKTASWSSYYGELNAEYQKSVWYRSLDWLNENFWIDVLMDLVSLFAFAYAIWELFRLFG